VLLSAKVELFLNIAWALLSILLIAGWSWSIHKGYTRFQWTALVALVLLLVLLFPVISMTDDRMAMSTPVEFEHVLRRSETPLSPVAILGLFNLFAAIMLVILSMAAFHCYARIRTRVFAERLLDGFMRAVGVRPPPAMALFAS
jgi:hypothetical protein